MNRYLQLILIAIIFLIISFLGYKAYLQSIEYEKGYIKYIKENRLNKNIEHSTNKLVKELFSNILGVKIKDTKKNISLEDIKIYKTNSVKYFVYFIISFLLSLLLYFFVSKVYFITYLYSISLLSLIIGLTSPILLFYIGVDFLGSNSILQFESNTILTSIDKLFVDENYIVAIIILLFSVLFPIFKTLISFVVLYCKDKMIIDKINYYTTKYSKLSMTDIFVLSIFLVYLSPKKGGYIHTELQIGFYFFLTYAILSLVIPFIRYKKVN